MPHAQKYTNFQYFYEYVGLQNTNDLFWLLYHNGRTKIEDLKLTSYWNDLDNIFLVDQELTLEDISDPRIHLWFPSIPLNPQQHSFMWWFDAVNEIEQQVHFIDKLTSFDSKSPEYIFDALLGTLREHKTYILNQINKCGVHSKFILGSLRDNNWHREDYNNTWVRGNELDTSKHIPYKFIPELMSCVLPYEIYNNSWYSLVCETLPYHIFYTEKIAKPILAKRMFVLIGAKHIIKGLHSMGYKTFSDVIDESYDNIDDDEERWNEAWKQIEKLLSMNPLEVYSKVNDIVEHNYNIFVNTVWWDIIKDDIKKIKYG